jgi:hypothetical protein
MWHASRHARTPAQVSLRTRSEDEEATHVPR